MRTFPTIQHLLAEYEFVIQAVANKAVWRVDNGFDLVVAYYREVVVANVTAAAGADADMLLFQYGVYDWYDARGEYFGLDITRQVIVEQEQEQVLYQLSLAFEFDPAPFSGCQQYNSWSIMASELADWVTEQKATEGFKLAHHVAFRTITIGLQEV